MQRGTNIFFMMQIRPRCTYEPCWTWPILAQTNITNQIGVGVNMWIIRAAVLMSALFFSNGVWAGSISINVIPDAVAFGCDALDAGSTGSVNGVSLGCGLNASGGETFNESAGEFTFEGEWSELNPTFTSGSTTVYFVDSNNEVTSILNYTFSTSGSANNITGSFQFDNSGAESLGALPGGATTVVQDGNNYQFSNYFFAGDVTTTVDPTEAPEPASLALMGVGVLGLSVVRRVRTRKGTGRRAARSRAIYGGPLLARSFAPF